MFLRRSDRRVTNHSRLALVHPLTSLACFVVVGGVGDGVVCEQDLAHLPPLQRLAIPQGAPPSGLRQKESSGRRPLSAEGGCGEFAAQHTAVAASAVPVRCGTSFGHNYSRVS